MFLSLVCWNSNLRMCIVLILFTFILLRIHWYSWICELLFLSWKFLTNISSNIFLFNSLFSFWNSNYIQAMLFDTGQWGPVFLKIHFPLGASFGWWLVFRFTHSFFACLQFSEFFIAYIVYSNFRFFFSFFSYSSIFFLELFISLLINSLFLLIPKKTSNFRVIFC